VAILPVDPDSPAGVSDRDDIRPDRLGELLPVSDRTDAEIAEELARISTAEAQLAAYRASRNSSPTSSR